MVSILLASYFHHSLSFRPCMAAERPPAAHMEPAGHMVLRKDDGDKTPSMGADVSPGWRNMVSRRIGFDSEERTHSTAIAEELANLR